MTEQPDEKRRGFLIGLFGGWIINIGAWTITGGGMNNYYYKPLRRSISKEYFDLPRKKKISGAAAWVDLQSVTFMR